MNKTWNMGLDGKFWRMQKRTPINYDDYKAIMQLEQKYHNIY